MNFRFQSKQRLIDKDQFDRVFEKKQKKTTKIFTVFYCKNDLVFSRLGVGVSKKNINKATKRNYFKRIVREAFRLNQNKLDNLDVLVFVNRGAKNATNQETQDCIKKQFESLL